MTQQTKGTTITMKNEEMSVKDKVSMNHATYDELCDRATIIASNALKKVIADLSEQIKLLSQCTLSVNPTNPDDLAWEYSSRIDEKIDTLDIARDMLKDCISKLADFQR